MDHALEPTQAVPGQLRHVSSADSEGRWFWIYKQYELSQSKVTGVFQVGRSFENDLVLEDGTISNYHFVLWLNKSPGRETMLRNLSPNGTYVNCRLIEQGAVCIIRSGAFITLGKHEQFLYWLDPEDRDPASAYPEGSIWRSYLRGEKLGSGTFGSVYQCHDRSSNSVFAVKIVDRSRFLLVPNSDKMFQREIRVLKALKSNHLKEVFDEKPMLYILLEYVAGGDLAQYLSSSPPLSENLTKHFTIQICKGVKFIHKQGAAHRDLKPANILLTADNPPVLKIADFGLAKMIENGSFLKTQCGTPDYMAPEVFKPTDAGYGQNVDSWSVGVIVFEMLTKRMPFRWRETQQLGFPTSTLKREMDMHPLSEFNNNEQCARFIQSLLHEVPNARFPISRALKHEWLEPAPGPELEEAAAAAPGNSEWVI